VGTGVKVGKHLPISSESLTLKLLRPPMLDLPVFEDAKLKLKYASENLALTGQPFYLAVGIKRPVIAPFLLLLMSPTFARLARLARLAQR
jgi:hypothetical protein